MLLESPVADRLVSALLLLIEVDRALNLLALRVFLDHRRVIAPARAEVSPELKSILLLVMLLKLIHDAILVIVFILLLVVFIISSRVFLSLRDLGMLSGCFPRRSLLLRRSSKLLIGRSV